MAAVSATCVRFGSSFQLRIGGNHQIIGGNSTLVSFGWARPAGGFPWIRTSRLQIRAAKAETVQKVSEIVRKQLALAPDTEVTPLTKFTELGADSLDTVEIVMGLEEEFDICVEEENAENITTIQEAADLIDKLVDKK